MNVSLPDATAHNSKQRQFKKVSLYAMFFKVTYNGSGIAEGRDLKDKSFNLAQMPNRSTND